MKRSGVRTYTTAVGWLLIALMALETSATSGVTTNLGAGDATSIGADWIRYNGDYEGTRYSPLSEVNTRNVGQLKPACEFDTSERGPFQTGLLVVRGTMYFTTALRTYALDATSCRQKWTTLRKLLAPASWTVNRGLAFDRGRLFRATTDGHFISLDAASGKILWDRKLVDTSQGAWISASPITWDNNVYIGTAGADLGANGRMYALDERTGAVRWAFDLVKRHSIDAWGTPGSDQHGGGSTWTSFTLDPRSGEIFIPVGNPAPDFAPKARTGDNSYTDSVVALDARNGSLHWALQQVHNDFHDWDTSAAPTLIGSGSGGLVVIPHKVGYIFIVDRNTRRVLRRVQDTTVLNPDVPLTARGTYACPSPLGATEWNGATFDLQTKLLYVPTVDWCATLKAVPNLSKVPYVKGAPYIGSLNGYGAYDKKFSGWLNAADPLTGKMKWRFHAPAPMVAGATSTAGGVVFAGDYDGNFYAFDATNGKKEYTYHVAGPLAGGLISYQVSGHQYVAFTSGNGSPRTPYPSRGTSRVSILTLKQNVTRDRVTVTANLSKAGDISVAAIASDHGAAIYQTNCSACHQASGNGVAGTFPPLAGNADVIGPPSKVIHIVKYGRSGPLFVNGKEYDGQMPAWSGQLSNADIASVANYIRSSWGNKAEPVSPAGVAAVRQ